jgi:hypothetical protein
MNKNWEKYKDIVGFVTAAFPIFIACITLYNTRVQGKFDNRMKVFEARMAENNTTIAKANSFSSLMALFIKGSDEEKEYALILMIQVDSVLAYKIGLCSRHERVSNDRNINFSSI